jgi:type VI secretion system secreted protein Hcp
MAFDTFIKFEGVNEVKGETTASGMEDAIEIYSFSFGASNPTTVGSGSGGLSAGKVSLSSFNIMKKTELSSTKLYAACCAGTHFAKATVTLRKAGGVDAGQQVFLTYVFEDVLIESIQWSGSTGGDDTPTESVSIAFGSCVISYYKQDDDTGVAKIADSASWDQTTVGKK